MKHLKSLIIVVIMGLLPLSLFGAKNKKVVDFNYPQDVSKNALADLDRSLKGGDGKLVVDAIVRYSIAQSGISNENMPSIVSRIDSTIQLENRPEYRALLCYFEARVFRAYMERYGLHDRENPNDEADENDFTAWDIAKFSTKINSLLQQALSQPDELKRHPITEFKDIITYDEQGATLVPTLYQFLCQEAMEMTDDNEWKARIGSSWKQSVAGNVPAYIYASLRCHDNAEKLYELFKDNEHCGLALTNTYGDEMYKAYRDYVSRFPQGYYTPSIQNKLKLIDCKQVKVDYPENLHSGDSVTVKMRVQNVNHITLQVYRMPEALVQSRRYNMPISQLTLVQSKTVNVQGTVPFDIEDYKVTLPPLPYGSYVIVPSYVADGEPQIVKNISTYDKLTVSDIALFYVTAVGNNNRLFAVDNRTGAPMSGVKVKGSHLSATTDRDGCVTIPSTIIDDEFRATRGNDRYSNSLGYNRIDHDNWSAVSAQVFTDLSIYRPGETVKVAAILYYQDYNSRKIKQNEPIRIRLMDTNGEPVDTISGVTDDYGRFEGKFKLPTDRMNGMWTMAVEYGGEYRKNADWHYINVSEYKTPTFLVSFPDAKPNYVLKQPIKIEGKAETYSGMPVANAEVKLTLRQKSWSWWWRDYSTRNQGEVISDTTVATDNEGRFVVEFPDSIFTESQGKCRWARYNYTLQAQVTDGAGETQESTHPFIVGVRRGISLPSSEMTFVNDKVITLPLEYHSTNEEETAVVCTWELSDIDNEDVVATGNLNSNHPVIDLTAVPSGQYHIKVHILDADEDEEEADAVATITLYRKNDKHAPVRDCTLWLHDKANTVDSNNVGHIMVGTSAQESHIYYVASDRKGVVKQGWLHYSPGLHDLQLDVPTDHDNYLAVQLVSYHNGKIISRHVRLTSPEADHSLHLHVTSFRDRLVPGQNERWTFRFTDKDSASRHGAMLLAMTDKAINDISENHWQLSIPQLTPNWYNWNWMRLDGSNNTYLNWSAERAKEKGYQLPELYTYGQELFGFLGRGRVLYKSAMAGGASYNMAVAEEQAEMLMDSEDISRSLEGRAAGVAVTELSIAEEETKVDRNAAGGNMKRLDDIKLREADIKTALWRPMLTSDEDGNVSVEFEAPEFNTTWILQAIGYDKDLYSDRLERQVVTQKPIMVKSSLPRFVRQGDQVTLSANLQNATDKATAVDAMIELFDPRTGETYASQNFRHTLAAHGSQAVSIQWVVPIEASFVGFRVKAANDQFGDGEQMMVPVLEAIQPVIETQPFYIEAATPQFSLQLPHSARNARVTLEYCDNPMWYCVTALPTIYDDHCVTASSLVHNLFALEVAQGVAKSQPQVREAINYWKANEQDSTLVSMLAKNQDLKIATLLASPWLREADRQTLRMSRLNELFDTPKMDKERTRIVNSLADLQLGDGGFTWFRYPGCRSSYYTTHEVLELLGEIQHLGYLKGNSQVDQMMSRALKYYDRETLKQYKERKNKKDYSGFSHFVYVRSLFPTVKMEREVQSLFDNALKQMSKDWSKGLSLGEKAFYALALNRNGHQKTARDITESIRQFAISKPALGTYWDNLQVGWRYFDKVAVTSTILQALNECDPRQDEIDRVRKWMLLMKQTNDWGSSSLAADAVYSLLSTGSQWLERNEPARITIGGEPLKTDKMDAYLGYFRKTIAAQPGAEVRIERSGNSPAWGAVYCQYQAQMTDIKQVAIEELSISKDYSIVGTDGKLTAASEFHVGDRVRVRTVIKCNRDLDFVTVVDERASCFEPVDKLSGYRSADRTWYYHETKDAQTRLFFSNLQKGTHVITYDVYVTQTGTFSAGIASAQCQYAPQIAAHSAGRLLQVR
ncbi:MAG: hypothetical protein IJ160_12970 [Muribaculaceae bacterium]|nr:hypothetical protein [Muribaculaceae bacterium]